jgi:hypothetical protein
MAKRVASPSDASAIVIRRAMTPASIVAMPTPVDGTRVTGCAAAAAVGAGAAAGAAAVGAGAAAAASVTVIVPVMFGWIEQRYENVPALANV